MQFNSKQPIWLQVRDSIKKDIIKGLYEPGEKLSPVRSYAIEYDVNPNTVQRALISLQDDGLVVTQSTNGNFVTQDINLIKKEKDILIQETIDAFIATIMDYGITKDEIHILVKEKIDNE